MPERYLLVDRDGTLIVEKDNLHDPDGVEIIPGAPEALRSFVDAGWGIAVVTNQSGIARGIFTVDEMHSVHERIQEKLAPYGLQVEAFFFCPHAPEISNCDCRKPKPGLVTQAVAALNFDPTRSIVVGDKAIDIGLGKAVGAQTVLVRTGYGSKAEKSIDVQPTVVIDDLGKLDINFFR